MRNQLLKNTFFLALVQLTNYIAPLVILIHLTKTLGLEAYGVLAFAQGVVAIGFVALDFGFGLSATNKISKNRNNRKYVSKVMGGVAIIKLYIYLFCCIALIAYSQLTVKYEDYSWVFVLSLFPLAGQGFMIDWFYQGIEKMHYIAALSILSKIMFAIAAVVFVETPSDYILVPFLNGISLFIQLFFSVVIFYKLGYKIDIPSKKTIIYCLKFTSHFFASRVAVSAYTNFAIIVLGLYAQPALVSIYSIAEQFYKVMQSAIWPVSAACYPYMAKSRDVNLMFKIFLMVLLLTIVGACVGYFIAPILIKMVFDDSWLASIPVLNIFLVAIVVHAAAVMTGYPLAATVGKLRVANSSVITGGIVYAVCLGGLLFFNEVSPNNLAMIMLLSELSVFLHRVIFLYPSFSIIRKGC